MKKQLLLASLLISFTNTAFSQEYSNHSYRNLGFTQVPTVSIGGHIDVNGAQASQEDYYSTEQITVYDTRTTTATINNRATDDIKLSTEASLLFKVNGINDYGFKYGAVFELNANSTQNSWNNDTNSTKSYIYGESFLGKFEVGNELGVSKKMKVDASTFARAAGGINGKYLNYINLPSSQDQDSPLFILIPELPTSHGGYAVGFNNLLYLCDINGDGNIIGTNETDCYAENANENFQLNLQKMENATKVSYYTPEIAGFQLGVSYTPDTGDKGTSGRLSSKLDTGDLESVFEYGATFKQTFYGIDLALSATGESGNSQTKTGNNTIGYIEKRENLAAYQFGGKISYFGLTVGGSIGNWQNSLNYIPTTGSPDEEDGTYQTIGLAYEFGPVNASIGYFSSEFQKNQYEAYSIGIDFKVAKGFMPYIEYTKFDFQPDVLNSNALENTGSVILAGFLLNF